MSHTSRTCRKIGPSWCDAGGGRRARGAPPAPNKPAEGGGPPPPPLPAPPPGRALEVGHRPQHRQPGAHVPHPAVVERPADEGEPPLDVHPGRLAVRAGFVPPRRADAPRGDGGERPLVRLHRPAVLLESLVV